MFISASKRQGGACSDTPTHMMFDACQYVHTRVHFTSWVACVHVRQHASHLEAGSAIMSTGNLRTGIVHDEDLLIIA